MPKQHFGYASDRVWYRMKFAKYHRASLRETTITDQILLDLHISNMLFQSKALFRSMQFAIIEKTPHGKEGKQGTDWEWWIGHQRLGWTRYAVQAKILFHKKGKKPHYHLLQGAASQHAPLAWQHQVLEKHASNPKIGAVPLYAFYNYVRKYNYGRYWHCKSGLDESKLGISVTHLKCVEHVLSQRNTSKLRNDVEFDAVHKFRKTIPLTIPFRCLACLQAMNQSEFGVYFPKEGEQGWHANYPEEIFDQRVNVRERKDVREESLEDTVVINLDNLPSNFYTGEPTDAPDIILKAEIDLQGRD